MNTIQPFRELLVKQNLDGLLISSVPNIIYFTGYAGFSEIEREAYLFITKTKQYIFTDGRYVTAVKKEIPNFTLQEITGATPFPKLLQNLITKHELKKIGFESQNLTVAEFVKLKMLNVTFESVMLRDIRVIKQSHEITVIQKACTLGDKVYRYVQMKLKTGISEKEIARDMELYIRRLGADIAFPTIVAFGENAAVPHHHTSERILQEGDFVLFDFGVKIEDYCSDMSRTVVFGDATDEQKRIHQTVLQAQKQAINMIKFLLNATKPKPIYCSEIDTAARNHITSKGYPSIPHSLGHGIGIEVHESPTLSPRSKDMLTNGMVFSIEPGIYIPDFGGVRIEDLFTIQKNKLVQLTGSPKGFEQFL